MGSVGAHEVGHCLGLYHTHSSGRAWNHSNNGGCGDCHQESVSRTKRQAFGCIGTWNELKCNVNGDFLCDTPADPEFISSIDINNTTDCTYDFFGRTIVAPNDLYLFGVFCGANQGCNGVYPPLEYPLWPKDHNFREENSLLNVYNLIQWQDSSIDILPIQVVREVNPVQIFVAVFINGVNTPILLGDTSEPLTNPENGGYIELNQTNSN